MSRDYPRTIVSLSLSEDIGSGDITTEALVPAAQRGAGVILLKSPGTVCGLEFAREAFRQLDVRMRFISLVKDGASVRAGTVVARLSGRMRALLSGERTALNFLGMLSGIATKTRRFVDAVKPYRTAILDTRKTTPLLREAERYAVRCGGGVNHRLDLSAMAMIKDNHLVSAGRSADYARLVALCRNAGGKPVALEVDTLAQLRQALEARPDVILLDNMTPAQVRQAVRMRDQSRFNILLEASGGISLKTVRAYAAAGVDRISIGGLTHSREALDFSLEITR